MTPAKTAEPLADATPKLADLPPSAPDASVAQRMIAILAELPDIGKTQYNAQQKFHFRGHDDVLNALSPLLAKHGVVIIPNVIERVTDQRTVKSGATMFEVNLHVKFTIVGATGDALEGSAWGEGTDMGDKATSKAMTMAFKYFVAQAFSVTTGNTQDPDGGTAEESTGSRAQPQTQGRRRDAAPARQQAAPAVETVDGVVQPTSWAEWSQRLTAMNLTPATHGEWMRPIAEGANADETWNRAKRFLTALTVADVDGMTIGIREKIQKIILETFAVEALGPPWAIDPEEAKILPSFDQVMKAKPEGNVRSDADSVGSSTPDAAAEPAAPDIAANADDDDIPF